MTDNIYNIPFTNFKLSTSFYLYIRNILNFINTILIKSDYINNRYNIIYNNLPNFDIKDKTTYPYYKNLCGNIHDLNVPMYINFQNKNNIALSKTTITDNLYIKEYLLSQADIFNSLLYKYRTQNSLIKGILYNYNNKYSIQDIIDLPNYSLIDCDLSYLDEQERENIKLQLVSFLKYYNYRWYINTFNYEEMYGFLSDSLLWILLPLVILYYKFLNIKTGFADDFNIWEYLISRGMESFKLYFSKSQSLYFYRNINYLLANKGKISTILEIKKIILDPLQYKLNSLFIFHLLEDKSKRPSSWYTEPLYLPMETLPKYEKLKKTSYNTLMSTLYDSKLDYLYNKEYIDSTKKEFKYMPYNKPISKYQEINISPKLDYKYYFYYIMFIFDNFVYLNNYNKISFTIEIVDYLNSRESIYIDNKIIIPLIYWLLYKSVGIVPTELPKIHNLYYSFSFFNKTDLINSLNNINTIVYNNNTYKYNWYIDLDYIKNNSAYVENNIINTYDKFTKYTETNYDIFKYLFTIQRYQSDLIKTNVSKILHQTLFKPQTINLINDSNINTYDEFFNINYNLKDFLDKYEKHQEYYKVFLYDIFGALCYIDPNIRKQFFLTEDDKIYKNKIFKLFNDFNSYRTKLIPKDLTTNIYFYTAFNSFYEPGMQIVDTILYPSKGTIFKIT